MDMNTAMKKIHNIVVKDTPPPTQYRGGGIPGSRTATDQHTPKPPEPPEDRIILRGNWKFWLFMYVIFVSAVVSVFITILMHKL